MSFDYKTASKLIFGEKVKDDDIRKFVSRARWDYDNYVSLSNTITDLRNELQLREYEIEMLKETLLNLEENNHV